MSSFSILSSLRNSQYAKTPSMRGYVKREDFAKSGGHVVVPASGGLRSKLASAGVQAFASAHSAYPAGTLLLVGASGSEVLWRLDAELAANAAFDEAGATEASDVYELTFVENDAYSPDATPDSDQFAFLCARFSDSAYGPPEWCAAESELVLDSELLPLLASTDWEVGELADLQASVSNTGRW